MFTSNIYCAKKMKKKSTKLPNTISGTQYISKMSTTENRFRRPYKNIGLALMFICNIFHVMEMRQKYKQNLENPQMKPLAKLDAENLNVNVAC